MIIYRLRNRDTQEYLLSWNRWSLTKSRIFKSKSGLSNFLSYVPPEYLNITDVVTVDLDHMVIEVNSVIEYKAALEMRIRKKHGQHGNHYTVKWQ
jgi:hypothetical protein